MQKDINQNLDKLNESYTYCRELAKNSNFYLGVLLTKKNKSNNIFAIYAWLRTVDDITDDENNTIEKRLIKLSEFHETTLMAIREENEKYCYQLNEKFWPAFRDTIIKYNIPTIYLENMIAGQRQDLIKDNYLTFHELYQYCYLVSSTAALIFIKISGTEDDKKAEQLAEWRGIALQLTNILRDINEDLKLNRVYLPAEFVHKDKLTAINFPQIYKEEIMNAINIMIAKTDEYYQKSKFLYKYVHDDGKLSVLIMTSYYQLIFNKIRANPKLIFMEKKIKLNKFEKFYLLFIAIVKSQLNHFF